MILVKARMLRDIGIRYQRDLEMVSQNRLALYYLEYQTPEICLAVVNQDEDALIFIKDPNLQEQIISELNI